MSEENNNSNNDLSREELNEGLDKVKNEEKRKKTGVLGAVFREVFLESTASCYTICPPPLPFRIWRAIFGKDSSYLKIGTCPGCRVDLQPDPEKKYDFRCPKCGKGFNNSDLSDSN